MAKSLDFQSIILTLQHFWADHGCLIWQPYYTQVGAGTMNPATYLRVLGPEPWNVAYVEPSIRPDDARYGENPNRMQMHYQFQVILKPDPGNPQELYLQSLAALGIDPLKHDIRFVEDNWEQPALGAWGLGWEVWLDGQEITQFTYFQQAGGQVLDPVSVEITYGLDRIAIALQRVCGFTEIRWNDHLTAGDVNLQAEQEHSQYYFEVADVERLRQMYALFEKEAEACLEHGLVLPAHDYILKCSHTFNVLDTRGAVGVTERQAIFGRMRELARRNSVAYLEQRQRLEYPFLREEGDKGKGDRGVGEKVKTSASPVGVSKAPLLFEIGTEELPVGDLDNALEQLRSRLPAWLDDLHLAHGALRILGTPRRLVAIADDLAARQPDREEIVKGPPASRAFDTLGQATKAAEGFARSKGVAVGDLQISDIDGGKYVTALVRTAGRPAQEVLAEALPGLIAAIKFDKVMRWNASNVAFSRPIRWLLALYGETGHSRVIPFEYAGLCSGNTTRGLRFSQPEERPVSGPQEYLQILEEENILLDGETRRSIIQGQVVPLANEVHGSLPVDTGLLAEVTNLVEAATALRGSFEGAYLELPREVLISVMKKHQRYFPVQSQADEKALLPYFIAVPNKDSARLSAEARELIVEGNEHVIRARFADAQFFIGEDLKKTLADFLPRLGTLTFQVKLGSMLDKTRRIEKLVTALAPQSGLPPEQAATAARTAQLCKADLATKMVVEMTSLQGSMGRFYALHSGESEAVANGIFEHYLPRFAGDALPVTRLGLLVGLADRLDTLAGLFAAGLAPTGAKDPFAQRRAALGLVQALIAQDLEFDLRPALQSAAANLPITASLETQAACLDFIVERLRNLLLDAETIGQKYRFDCVEAVVAAQGYNPAGAARAVRQLTVWIARPDWNSLLPAYARCVRITRDQPERYPVDPAAFAEPAEGELYQALQPAEASGRAAGSVDDFLNAFIPMIPAINTFFDKVLVMAEDGRLRSNRLGLLQRIAALAQGVADMSKLEGF